LVGIYLFPYLRFIKNEKHMKLLIQDLKNRKSYIIAKIASLGCAEETKSFMSVMMMEVEFGFNGTVYELVMTVFNSQFRQRAKRSGQKLAEVVGAKAQREGLEEGYSITKFL